jgi:hypothetical protein
MRDLNGDPVETGHSDHTDDPQIMLVTLVYSVALTERLRFPGMTDAVRGQHEEQLWQGVEQLRQDILLKVAKQEHIRLSTN